jgi:hypothetical protein
VSNEILIGCDNYDLCIYNSDNQRTEKIGDRVYEALWSPDGSRIVYSYDEELWVMDKDGGEKKLLLRDMGNIYELTISKIPGKSNQNPPIVAPYEAPTPIVYEPKASQFSDQIAYTSTDGNIWLIEWKAGQRTQITQDGSSEVQYYDPEWSPNGKELAFTRYYKIQDQWEIGILDPATREQRVIVPGQQSPMGGYLKFSNLRWSPDGEWLYAIEYGGPVSWHYIRRFNVTSGRIDQNFPQLFAHKMDVSSVDGRIILTYYVNSDGTYWAELVGSNGVKEKDLVQGNTDPSLATYIGMPRWANDGKRFLLVTSSPDANTTLEIQSIDDPAFYMVYQEIMQDMDATIDWSPDDRKIVINDGSLIVIFDLEDGTFQQVTDQAGGGISWNPSLSKYPPDKQTEVFHTTDEVLERFLYMMEQKDVSAFAPLVPGNGPFYSYSIEGGEHKTKTTFLAELKNRLPSGRCVGVISEQDRYHIWTDSWKPEWVMSKYCYVDCQSLEPPWNSSYARFTFSLVNEKWMLHHVYLNREVVGDFYTLPELVPCNSTNPVAITPPVAPSSCPGAPKQRMTVGNQGYVCTLSDRVRLRNGPSKNAEILAMLSPGTAFTITGGPSCANNGTFWQIRTTGWDEGWILEGEGDPVDPYFICPMP